MKKKDYIGAFALIVAGITFMCVFYTIGAMLTGASFVYPGQK
jgi:hypothetical protein